MKKFIIENKIIIAIILASFLIGGFVYASQLSKQKSIAKQEKKEYVVKRKKDCYDYETSERKKFFNVKDSSYDEIKDVCKVRYINKEWKEGDPDCHLSAANFWDNSNTTCIAHYFTKEF